MCWKWTIQKPTPIHIYHKIMWESNFHAHFYKKIPRSHATNTPSRFYKRAPRPFEEAKIDFIPIGRWFGEEIFTYVRFDGSLAPPHVLPLHVPDKLLAREISYQIVGDGSTKTLKKAKKYLWPSFPIQCGVYALHDFKHASLEIDNIACLNLATIMGRQFDPNKVAHNVTAQVKIRKFSRENDYYDDLFKSAKIFSQVQHLATLKLNPERVAQFK